MATKTTTTTTTKSTRAKSTTAAKTDIDVKALQERETTLIKENEEIKAQLNETQRQLQELMAQIQNNIGATSEISSNIDDETEVLVISLVPHKLNLLTDNTGKGVVYSFSQMYEEQLIDYGDLKAIVRSNRDMVNNGRFYIMNDDVVKKLRLKTVYTHLLKPDELKGLLQQKPEQIVEIYKLAPEGQKQIIVDMVIDAKFNKGRIDANLLQELGKLCGKDLLNMENPVDEEI